MSTNHEKCALITPEPYKGQVRHPNGQPGELGTVIEAATYFDLPPLIIRRGDWAICQDGIHCLILQYTITKNRFNENDWIAHVTEKTWVNAGDFIAIFNLAKNMVELEMI